MRTYICDICKRELDYHRNKLIRQTYTQPPYSKAETRVSYDLCLPCYNKIEKYIKELQEIFKEV